MMAITNTFMVEYARMKARQIEEIELSLIHEEKDRESEEKSDEKDQ
nr:hypothetical protein [Candidatus Sigynarchaeota archaeon]